jgi:hypothetical protein
MYESITGFIEVKRFHYDSENTQGLLSQIALTFQYLQSGRIVPT